MKDGKLFRKSVRDGHVYLLLVLPKALRNEAIQKSHDSVLSGHLGIARTFVRIN